MILSRRVALRPTPAQAHALGRACGAARWAFNWGLARKKAAWIARQVAIAAGVDPALAPKVPTAIDLHKELNVLKNVPMEEGGVPWMREVSKCAPQEALRDLDKGCTRYFQARKAGGRKVGYPQFKRKGRDPGHFRACTPFQLTAARVQIPRIGHVVIMPGDRGHAPPGRYTSVSIVEEGGHWFASVRVEVPEASVDDTRLVVGLDAGVRELAHLSDGTVFENPRALEKEAKRLRRAALSVARKRRAADKRFGIWKKGERRVESKRLQLARRQSARISRRVANIRNDALHKVTTTVARNYSCVRIEVLASKNMTRKAKGRGRAAKAGLNRAILDSGMLRLRRLLAYKMPLHGGRLETVDPRYTSQTCSRCQVRTNCGSSKTFKCEFCGMVADRDHNASLNILVAASWPETQNARGGDGIPRALGPGAVPGETRSSVDGRL